MILLNRRIFFSLILFLILMFLLGMANQVKATGINIVGNSVFRTNATNATINFMSDTAGTFYYQITSTSAAPEDILSTGVTGNEINANELVNFSPTGLTDGKKYIHIIVKGTDNSLSNVLTVSMPYNTYYFEDFEAYAENTYPNNFFVKYSGVSSSTITATQKNGESGKVFNLNGQSSWSCDQRVSLTGATIGNYVVYEADAYIANSASSSAHGMMLGQNSVSWTGSLIRFAFGKNNAYCGTGDSFNSIDTNPAYTTLAWYKLKISLDYSNRKADVYINDVKINTEQISAHPTYTLDYFGIWTGNANSNDQMYYDNIKFYVPSTTATFNYNGATGGNSTSSKTVAYGGVLGDLPEPTKTGYAFGGWYLDTDFNTQVDSTTELTGTESVVLYAKWTPITKTITITIDPEDTGTTNPSSPIIVNYGSNKEIEISAQSDYRIKKVLVDDVNKTSELVNNKLTLMNITENIEVKIEFEVIPRNINIRNLVNGVIKSNKITATPGEAVALTITPDQGYKLKNVTILNSNNEMPVELKEKNTFTMPNYNVFIDAEFELVYTEKTLIEESKGATIKGNFTQDAKLVITKIEKEDEEYKSFITLIDEDKEIIGSYEATIEGGEYKGELILTFTVDVKYNADTVTIYHKKANGEIDIKTAKVENGKVTITVNELSPFILAIDKSVQEQKDETPKTGDIVNYIIEVILIALSIIVAVIIYNKKLFMYFLK